MAETTSLGAAIAAGCAKGIDVWDMEDVQPVPSDTFLPAISEDRKFTFILYVFVGFFWCCFQ